MILIICVTKKYFSGHVVSYINISSSLLKKAV